MTVRSYTELSRYQTFEDRYEYLRLLGSVGQDTFGFDRYLNQKFYTSNQWKNVRAHVTARDLGMDLGVEGYEIHDRIIIHHMNPMVVDDIRYKSDGILDPEFLITTTHRTHNAIHYGDKTLLPYLPPERKSGDTRLW